MALAFHRVSHNSQFRAISRQPITTSSPETQHHTTAIMSKSVSFAPCPTTSCVVPRVEGINMENVYYQEKDYIRFRRELWREQMLDSRIKARRQRRHEFMTQQRDAVKRLCGTYRSTPGESCRYRTNSMTCVTITNSMTCAVTPPS